MTSEFTHEQLNGAEINFSNLDSFSTKSQEIRNSVLTGQHSQKHKLRPANIVLSSIRDLTSDQGSFSYVDCKDSHFQNCKFKGCNFDYAALINCEFRDCSFVDCSFHNVSITGVEFYGASFTRCALDHMVVENCRFWNCQIDDCTTSNKLFEFCIFADCQFKKTDLQIQTIVGNFGITQENLIQCRLRDKSSDEDFHFLKQDDIAHFVTSTAVEKFKVVNSP